MKDKILNWLKDNLFTVVVTLMIVMVVIIPLPAFLVEILITLNIILALMLLVIVLCTEKVKNISIFFPSLVLLLTIFNLAVSISATRLILTKGAELNGWLINAFSYFFTGSGKGALIISFLIFMIIIAVEFIVIVKGCTRVSEVAARFTLDSMQVKLMAIETEYSEKAITEEEAQEKKKEVQKESDFFGMLDGAIKFVSGNERIRIIIFFFSIIGIIPIGLRGESINDAFNTYIPFIISNGLLCMLPSFILSLPIVIIVSRFANERFMAKSREQKDEKAGEISPIVTPDALSLELGYDLVPLVEKEKGVELLERIQGVRRNIALDLGLVIPKVRIVDSSMLEPSEYCFKIMGIDAGRGKIRLGYYLCIDPGTVKTVIQGEKTVEPAFGIPAIWIDQEKRDEAECAGYTVADPPAIIATHLTEIIRRHAAEILDLQNTQAILDTLRKEYPPAVVDEALREGKGLRITEIQKILHGLLRERVSIRNMVSILESIADYASVSKNIWFLTEKARQAVAREICYQYADKDRRLRVLTIDPALEQKIIDSKHETPSGIISVLDPPFQKMWIKAVEKSVTAVKEKGWMPVVLCSEQARFLVKNSTDRELPDLAVLSVPEIVPGIIPEAVGIIKIKDIPTEQ